MKKLITFLKESSKLLKNNPKLFLPKLLLSALYGWNMLWTSKLFLRFVELAPIENLSPEEIPLVKDLLGELTLALIALLAISVLDLLIGAMYSVIVKDYHEGKEISFKRSFKTSLKKAKTIIAANFIILGFFFVASSPIMLIINSQFRIGNFFGFVSGYLLLLALTFFMAVLFYMIYPVTVFEKNGVISSLLRTIDLSKNNLGIVAKASLFPFLVSLTNYGLAFLSDKPEFLFLFVLLRFLTAVIYTYHLVLNPNIYLEKAI